MNEKPTKWLSVSFSPKNATEKNANTIKVMTSCIVFNCAAE